MSIQLMLIYIFRLSIQQNFCNWINKGFNLVETLTLYRES